MPYIITEDLKVSLDGVNVVEFTEGEILENPTPLQLQTLGDKCEKCEDEDDVGESLDADDSSDEDDDLDLD